LALASGTKPISRKVAATKLAELLQRVETVNGNPEYISRITKVCVFGSFLTAARELSDVDIAYASERRYFGEEYRKQAEKRIDIATANGRRFGTMMDRLGWPDTEILRLLKDRSRGLSLHLDSELVQLDCPFKELFPTNQMADDPDLKAAILDVAKTRSGSRS